MQDHNNDNHFDEPTGFPFDQNRKNPFSSPDGYFDALSNKVFAKIEAEEELKAFPILSSIPKQQPFAVPAHYFENSLEWQAELAAYPGLAQISKPFLKMPEEGYFEDSVHQLLYKAELADELSAYPALHALDKQQTGFTVAPAYFDNLAERVKDRIFDSGRQPVTIFSRIMNQVFGPKFAVSFGAALLIVFGLFVYNRPGTAIETPGTDCGTLACLEKNDLLNDNTVHTFDEDNLFDMVDVKALDQQISKEISKPDETVQEQYIIDNVNTDQLLDEL